MASSLPTYKGAQMQSQVKNALITTGIVLATIFVMRKITFTKDVIDKALNG